MSALRLILIVLIILLLSASVPAWTFWGPYPSSAMFFIVAVLLLLSGRI